MPERADLGYGFHNGVPPCEVFCIFSPLDRGLNHLVLKFNKFFFWKGVMYKVGGIFILWGRKGCYIGDLCLIEKKNIFFQGLLVYELQCRVIPLV